MQARSAIMGFKLKVLINEWFTNGMSKPIDLTLANDLDDFKKNSWTRRSKQHSILKLLKDESQSGVPTWLKSSIDIYFVQRIYSILNSTANDKETKLLLSVASQRPLYKKLINIKQVKNTSELTIDDEDLDYLACQSFMNRKHSHPTIEGSVAADILFLALKDQTLSFSDIKHLESIAFSTPKEMVTFLNSTIDALMNIETPDEKKRLFINYCLQSIDPEKKIPQPFEALQQTYPNEMDEVISWSSVSPVTKFSKNALKSPLSTYQINDHTSRQALIKKLSSLGGDIKELIPGQLCHPEMMTLFYKDSNQYLKTSLDLHKMKLDESKENYAKTQKIPFRLSLCYAFLAIGIGVLGHTTLVASSIIIPVAIGIGLLGLVLSQTMLFRGIKNDSRHVKTVLPTFYMDITFLTLATFCIYATQPYAAVVLPCVLGAMGGIMPFVSQLKLQNIVNKHIDSTPLPQTAKVKEIIQAHQLGSMFKIDYEENHVCFVKDTMKIGKGVMV